MVADSQLKIGKVYLALITDTELGDLCGKNILVKFGGIGFRNVEYLKDGNKEKHEERVIKAGVKTNKKNEYRARHRDEILLLPQLKIYREVKPEDYVNLNIFNGGNADE